VIEADREDELPLLRRRARQSLRFGGPRNTLAVDDYAPGRMFVIEEFASNARACKGVAHRPSPPLTYSTVICGSGWSSSAKWIA
jgi:hypothetical protein